MFTQIEKTYYECVPSLLQDISSRLERIANALEGKKPASPDLTEDELKEVGVSIDIMAAVSAYPGRFPNLERMLRKEGQMNDYDPRQHWQNGKQYAYILDDCIDTEELKGEFPDDRTKLFTVLACFKDWDCEHERRKFPTLGDRIGNWLRGLPSVCSVDYDCSKIVKRAYQLGMIENEKQEDNLLTRWYEILGQRIIELAHMFNLDYDKIPIYDYERTIQEQIPAAGV